MAGAALLLLALLATSRPAIAQGQPAESYQLPYSHQPLPLAYLGAPYTGGPVGRSSELKSGGASIVARFLPRPGLQPWDGIPFGLFKKAAPAGAGTRLGLTGKELSIGGGTPLDLRLYAFLAPGQSGSAVRLLTYEADAWKRRSETFSVLADTTFVLAVPVGGGAPVWGGSPGGQSRNPRPGSVPGYGPGAGGKTDIGGGDSVGCVNKRTAPPGDGSPSCEADTGEVIEDPLTGEPALLMFTRQGPPQWLTSVPTEICADGGTKLPAVTAPFGTTSFSVPLVERKGAQVCTRASVALDYLLVKERGLEIDGVKLRRLGSRGGTTAGWRMLAQAPTRSSSAIGWVQHVVLIPPGPPPVAGAPKSAPPPPAPVPGGPPTTFSVILSEWRWGLSISRLWYAPLPAGVDAGQPLQCKDGAARLGAAVWSKDKLTAAESVSVRTVFKLPPALRLDVAQRPGQLVAVRQGLVLLAEGTGGGLYCGIAAPPTQDGTELEGKLQDEEKAAPPPPPPPPVTAALVLQREGPAPVIVERLSQGKATKIADLLDAAPLTRTVQWSAGDVIWVRPADPDFQGVSAVKVDGAPFTVPDDKRVEIPLTAQMRTIMIKTALRPLTVPLAVATPHGAIEVSLASGKTTFPMDAQPRRVLLKGVRLGEEVTIEPKDDRLMVARLTLRGGSGARTVDGGTFRLERGDIPGGSVDLRLDVELRSNAVVLPAELLLKPVVQLGRRRLALAGCKITLAGFPEGGEFHHESGGTRVKARPDKPARRGASYRVDLSGSAKVCGGFEAEPVQAEKLALAKDAELAVPVRLAGGRAFVGVLSWPLSGSDDEGNWRAALKALVETYETGADEGRYLWGAIYAPDGKKVIAGETADYMPMEPIAFSPGMIARLKAGGPPLRFEEAVKRAVADVADLEGTVDLLVIAADAEGACTWTNPFSSAATRGGRSALVRVRKATPGQSSDPDERAHLCDVGADKDGVGMAVEVAIDPAAAGAASDRLLREALDAAAKSLLTAPPPPPEPKAKGEPSPGHRGIASAAPVGKSTMAETETYQEHYDLPDAYRPLAVAYLAAPYSGGPTGPTSMFRLGTGPPAASLTARFLKRADGAEPWQGVALGLFKGKAGPETRLGVTDGTLALAGSKALLPTLYLFVSDELRVAGLRRVVTFPSDAGRKAGDVFSVWSDTSFLLQAYLDAPSIGIESIACVNKGHPKDGTDAACEDGSGQVVEDPLSGGPALLMLAGSGPPTWLASVPTEICVDGVVQAPPKVAVPVASAQHKDVQLTRQGERWCAGAIKLDYGLMREAGLRINREPLRKRLDSRLKRSPGAWALWAATPRKAVDGDWEQRLLLVAPE